MHCPNTAPLFSFSFQPELVGFSHQVALAMAFLEQHQLLHRDLAARNVLVTKERNCKLGDFGLSRRVGMKDYYRRNVKSAPIPIR
jgi:serine/threonine protein kinase